MNEVLYCIEDQQGSVVARDLNIDNALILLRALFDAYYQEDDIAYIITRQTENENEHTRKDS